jgi:hypothetical protein
MTFTIKNATGKTTEINAATFGQAVAKYADIRRAELNTEHKGVKAINTIRAEMNKTGSYDCNGHRFNLLVKWFTPTIAPDRVAIMDSRGEDAMRRGHGHY